MNETSTETDQDRRVVLSRADEADKPVLANLIELYRHDLSEFRGYEVSARGTFGYRFLDAYFLEQDREACFIRHDGQLAGFAMTRAVADGHQIAEFFVLRAHRRQRVGATAAWLLFARHPGRWTVAVDRANRSAVAFWQSVVEGVADGPIGRTDERPPTRTFDQVVLRFRVTA